MKKINFKKLQIFTDISRQKSIEGDISKDLGDVLYRTGTGITALSLSLKIYESTGPIEITEPEEELIREAVNKAFVPAVIEAVNNQLNEAT